MKHKSLLAFGLLVGGLLIFPPPTAAQGCYVCDDEWMSNVTCGNADWVQLGWTECEVVWTHCEMSGERCWGPDPEEEQLAALAVRADGTLILAVAGELSLATPPGLAEAEMFGFSSAARIYERNCKGLITRRIFGKAVRKEINQRVQRLTI